MNNATTITATTTKMIQGNVDETKYAKFVAKTEKGFVRAAAKGHRDFAGWTGEKCRKAAEDLCGIYRHQFRTLTPA